MVEVKWTPVIIGLVIAIILSIILELLIGSWRPYRLLNSNDICWLYVGGTT